MSITDKRGFWDIIWPSIRRIAIGFGLFILLLGFTPIFKKRFSKKIKHNPTIEARPRPYGRTTEVHGRFTKDTLSTILPFVAEKGTLKFVPNGTAGVASMKLKSGGGMRCTILNVGSYAGRSEISIDGSSVPAGQRKPMSKSANMTIEVTTNEMIYTCSPTR